MRIALIVVVVCLVIAASFGFALAICQIPGFVPPCQNKGLALSSEYTGPQVVNGHRVQCFAGQIVKVEP
jgi:hypothetical protein